MLTLGAVDDRSLKLGLGCGLAAAVVGMGLLWLFPSQLALVYVGALVFGVCYSSAGVLNPLLPREVFGTRDVSAIYARTSMPRAPLPSAAADTIQRKFSWDCTICAA